MTRSGMAGARRSSPFRLRYCRRKCADKRPAIRDRPQRAGFRRPLSGRADPTDGGPMTASTRRRTLIAASLYVAMLSLATPPEARAQAGAFQGAWLEEG